MEASAPTGSPATGAPTTSAPPVDAGKPAAPPEIRKLKLKVNQQEFELPEDEVVRGYQKGLAADQKFREAAQLRKSWEDDQAKRKAKVKEDPWQALKDLELDDAMLDKLSEDRLIAKLRVDTMNPDQKKAYQAEQELKALKAQQAEREKEHLSKEEQLANQRQEALTLEAVKHVDHEIGSTLKAAGIKADPEIVAYMADLMYAHLERGGEGAQSLPAAKALEMVNAGMRKRVSSYLTSLPIDKAIELLPKEFLDGVRRHFLGKVRSQSPTPRSGNSQPPTRDRAKAGKQSTDSFFDRLERKIR